MIADTRILACRGFAHLQLDETAAGTPPPDRIDKDQMSLNFLDKPGRLLAHQYMKQRFIS
jgi:hypothetical protein